MTNPKDSNGGNEFLLRFSKFLEETSPEASLGELKSSLSEQGVKVERLLSRAKEIFDSEADARRRERRTIAMKEQAEFLSRFDHLNVSLPKTVEGLKKLINDLVSGVPGQSMQPAFVGQWRKYEGASYDDLKLLAEDLLKMKALSTESEDKNGPTA